MAGGLPFPTGKGPKAGLNIYGTSAVNPYKCTVMAEELGIEYNYINLDIVKGEMYTKWYTKNVNPNGKVPAIVHVKENGSQVKVWESGACLLYMAHEFDKDHKFLNPIGTQEYWTQLSWLSWQISGYGPMMGQTAHFNRYLPSEKDGDYGSWRFTAECRRLHTSTSSFVAGGRMTVADFAAFIFAQSAKWCGIDIKEPLVEAWHDKLAQRPAFQKALYASGDYPFSDEATSQTDGEKLEFLKMVRKHGTQGIKGAHQMWMKRGEEKPVPVPSDHANYEDKQG
ncbi:glutathione S-transferase [Apiospora phragmitis]|uniref:Glutathione S-transferase n=1 Tax=Apiospora phragmitis TaxID=2905665 RepID=A0ABR1WSX0_9PEZI